MKPENIRLRDWFAGLAMQKLVEEYGVLSQSEAQQAYYIADKMMEERRKK